MCTAELEVYVAADSKGVEECEQSRCSTRGSVQWEFERAWRQPRTSEHISRQLTRSRSAASTGKWAVVADSVANTTSTDVQRPYTTAVIVAFRFPIEAVVYFSPRSASSSPHTRREAPSATALPRHTSIFRPIALKFDTTAANCLVAAPDTWAYSQWVHDIDANVWIRRFCSVWWAI